MPVLSPETPRSRRRLRGMVLFAAAAALTTACRPLAAPPPQTSPTAAGWTKDAANPILVNNPSEPDRSFVADPAVLHHEGTFYLYYPSAWQMRPEAKPDDAEFDEIAMPISLATSTDGRDFTVDDRGTPEPKDDYVLERDSEGSWDGATLETPTVLFDPSDGTFKMWFSASSNEFGDKPERFTTFRIGYATSPDGKHWTKYDDPATKDRSVARSDPVLAPRPDAWDNLFVSDPTVVKDGPVFKMWYTGGGHSGDTLYARIGYAESRDGIHWDRREAPVLEADEREGYVNGASVLQTPSGYEMWFYVEKFRGVFHATSADGVAWIKDGLVIPAGDSGAWDEREVSSPAVVAANGQYWLYYTGSSCPIDARAGDVPKGCQPHIKIGLATRAA